MSDTVFPSLFIELWACHGRLVRGEPTALPTSLNALPGYRQDVAQIGMELRHAHLLINVIAWTHMDEEEHARYASKELNRFDAELLLPAPGMRDQLAPTMRNQLRMLEECISQMDWCNPDVGWDCVFKSLHMSLQDSLAERKGADPASFAQHAILERAKEEVGVDLAEERMSEGKYPLPSRAFAVIGLLWEMRSVMQLMVLSEYDGSTRTEVERVIKGLPDEAARGEWKNHPDLDVFCNLIDEVKNEFFPE